MYTLSSQRGRRSPSPDSTNYSSSSLVMSRTPPPPARSCRAIPSQPGHRSLTPPPSALKRRHMQSKRGGGMVITLTPPLPMMSDELRIKAQRFHTRYGGKRGGVRGRDIYNSRVSKSRSGGMGITHTPPLHSDASAMSDDEDEMKVQGFCTRNGGKQGRSRMRDVRNLLVSKSRSPPDSKTCTFSPPDSLQGSEMSDRMSDREHEMKVQRFHTRNGGKRKGARAHDLNHFTRQIWQRRVVEVELATFSMVEWHQLDETEMEWHPLDRKKNKGAVTLCHDMCSKESYPIILVGVGDEFVMAMDHDEIMELIESSPRPLRLTFKSPSDCNRGQVHSESMVCWHYGDGKMRFRCR